MAEKVFWTFVAKGWRCLDAGPNFPDLIVNFTLSIFHTSRRYSTASSKIYRSWRETRKFGTILFMRAMRMTWLSLRFSKYETSPFDCSTVHPPVFIFMSLKAEFVAVLCWLPFLSIGKRWVRFKFWSKLSRRMIMVERAIGPERKYEFKIKLPGIRLHKMTDSVEIFETPSVFTGFPLAFTGRDVQYILEHYIWSVSACLRTSGL